MNVKLWDTGNINIVLVASPNFTAVKNVKWKLIQPRKSKRLPHAEPIGEYQL